MSSSVPARVPASKVFLVASGLIALVALLGRLPALAQEGNAKYFVDVRLDGLARARDLAAAGFDVAGVNRAALTAGVVASSADLDRLTAMGFKFEVRQRMTTGRAPDALQDYTDPQELSTFMDQVQAAYPTLAKKFVLKDTLFEGQKQYAMKITKDVSTDNDRPAFILDAQHHAREVMTAEIARDVIDYLTRVYVNGDPLDPSAQAKVQRWVDNVDIWVVGSVNPDGAMYVFQHDTSWRKNRRPSCPVDVNRNYRFMWGSCNGSTSVCTDETNRGASAESEPETQGMVQLVQDVRPFYALTYHSYGEYLMYSYGCTDPDELAAMDEVAQGLNDILPNDAGQTGQWLTGPIWSTIYPVDGGSSDTQYGAFGAYAFAIEVNSSSFQPDYATWRNITVQRQRTAWQYFLDKILDGPQIRGKVTDAATGLPLAAEVDVQEVTFTHGESPRTADAKGNYHWLAQNGRTYHLTFSMPGYCSETRTVTVGAEPATLDVALGHPSAPSGIAATANGDNRIDVSWDGVAGATEYRVYRGLAPGGPYGLAGTVAAPATTLADSPVSAGVTWYYVVRAYDRCESPSSAEASASTTGACTLGPGFAGVAVVTDAAASTCTVNLTWAAASARCGGLVTYRVHRSATAPFVPSASNVIASGLSTTQYSDHDAVAFGTTYSYVVRAVDSASGADDGNTRTLSAAPTGPLVSGTFTDDAGDTGTAKLSASSPWSVLASGGKAGPKVYATGTYSNNQCAALATPAIALQNGAVLSFASKYDLEGNYDAGIVEVATAPLFDTWTRLATVNYPDRLLYTGNACGFPTSGVGTVFSRTITTPAYPASSYTGSLSAYNGATIKLRFSLSSDSGVTRAGWWIDDIRVTNALLPGTCSPGTAGGPTEVSPDASPMTSERASLGSGVALDYRPACGALDNAVYWGSGPIAGASSWSSSACAVGNTGRAAFDPGDPQPGEFYYFVIVGQTSTKEGSYGFSQGESGPAERPEAAGVGACDRPQELTGACP
ncbi:MAG: carboxypeptidase regulatory-like domain-containing protein [Acidobacteriia bacterium]|nr:carboxypeptidase regulatory-like domain-containing protein [Terriglobia bacterium]